MALAPRLLLAALAALLAAASPSLADGDGKAEKKPEKAADPETKDGKDKEAKDPGKKPDAMRPEALLKGLLNSFESFDADGDGRISQDELPLGELFETIDGDGDGFLLRDEIRKFIEGRSGKGADPAAPADETFADRCRRLIATDPRFNAVSRREEFLRNFDRDPKDGKVERKEYPGNDGDRAFRKFDRDKDGNLDENEVLGLVKEQITDLAKARRHPDRNGFMYLYDLDMDRTVTREEYNLLRGPASSFKAWDVDEDGVITDDEIRYPERYKPMGKGGNREAAGQAAETRTFWDLYDKDGDRRVSPDEFKGGDAVFRRLDTDGDGYLTTADG